jgi:ABC-type taurine transport system ATPase subunit
MLTRLTISNFKQFENVDIELGQRVVFVGPNNSGKTSALQALALWELGVRRWSEKRGGETTPRQRSGVTINRRDLVALPVPETNLLWRDLRVRQVMREQGKQKTRNIRVTVEVSGVTGQDKWDCGMEFDFANAESIYCRPMGWSSLSAVGDGVVPEPSRKVRIAYLPPMSGLASNEYKLEPGTVNVRLGEGRTAEVLRNLCHTLHETAGLFSWNQLVRHIDSLFRVTLDPPVYVADRGELVMSFRDHRGVQLDLSAAGRGLQQTMLLLAFLLGNPGAVLLLDEPDAHLEILRQKQTYNALCDVAEIAGSQIVAASHSEVILNEAADRDLVVAFVGKPHRIDDRGSQVLKALKSIGFDQYYLAETTGWVLYLEGPTDLQILRAFARILNHPATPHLERPFSNYICNHPADARKHFGGLCEAKKDLLGIVLTDRLEKEPLGSDSLVEFQWKRREIENYLCFPQVLERYAERLAADRGQGALFARAKNVRFRKAMQAVVRGRVPPDALGNPADTWWSNVKATDEFLDPVFEAFFKKVGLPNLMRKTDYHELAALVPAELIDGEVARVLDLICIVAERAKPVR